MLSISLVIQKILSFVYFSYLATRLGVEQTGLYFFALSFITMLAVFVDLGMNNTLIKQVAKEPTESSKYFSQAVLIRLGLGVIMYLVLLGLSFLLGYEVLTRQALYLAGIIMVVDSFTLMFYSFWRAHHNTVYESLGNILFQVSLLIVGGVVLYLTGNILLALLALLLSSLINFSFALFKLISKLKIKFRPVWDGAFVRTMLLMAMPFAWAGIFSRLYGYLDTFLLKTLVGDAALGYYSLPYKITFVWQFIPLALVASLYPAFTAYYQTDKDKLAKLFNKTFIYLLVIAVPLSLGLSLMSGSIFLHIYGTEYLPSAAALQVLVFTLPFLFLNFPIGYLLNACDKQVRNTINIGIAMLISLIGNLIIIPRFSFVGASYVSVFTTAVLFILGFIVATRVVKINWKNLGINILKLIVCSAGLIAAILLTANNIHYLISIVISGLVYIVLVLVTKLVSWAEVVGLIKAFKNSE